MSGFSQQRGDSASAPPGFTAKPRQTAKARHKSDQARVTAHALSVGRTGKARERKLDAPEETRPRRKNEVPVVPRREGAPEPREHVRRDIGSHASVFELGAPDTPEDVSAPFTDPKGTAMRWAVRCLTHDQTRYFADHRAAIQAVKASHGWCEGCAAAVAASRKIHARPRPQPGKAREGTGT